MTELQEKKLEYNNKALAEFKDNFIELRTLKEKREYKETIIRRKKLQEEAKERVLRQPKTFIRNDRTVIFLKDLTEDIIDKEISYGFELGRDK